VSGRLPRGFEDLDAWVDEWALPTQNQRWRKRLNSTREELLSFYDAVQPRLEAILDHADAFEIGRLPSQSASLFDLALMLAEIAPNVELYDGSPDVPHSFEETRFVAAHGDDRH